MLEGGNVWIVVGVVIVSINPDFYFLSLSGGDVDRKTVCCF